MLADEAQTHSAQLRAVYESDKRSLQPLRDAHPILIAS